LNKDRPSVWALHIELSSEICFGCSRTLAIARSKSAIRRRSGASSAADSVLRDRSEGEGARRAAAAVETMVAAEVKEGVGEEEAEVGVEEDEAKNEKGEAGDELETAEMAADADDKEEEEVSTTLAFMPPPDVAAAFRDDAWSFDLVAALP
jgi:hypothetical protein